MPRPSRAKCAALAVSAFAVLATGARAADYHTDTVQLDVAGSATVAGTIRSASERESFVLNLPAGAVVTATAKRRGKGSFVPQLDLIDALDAPVAAGIVKGKGSSLRTPAGVPVSGAYRLRVFGDTLADGDYTLKLSVKPRGAWVGSGDAAPAAATIEYEFGAPAGAQAQIRLAAPRGSGFVPGLEAISGPDGYAAPLSGTQAGPLTLGSAGTYAVAFRDGGVAGGPWTCSVKLRLPRAPRPSSIDISSNALTGKFGSDEQVFGTEVGAGGGLVDPPDLGGSLDGAVVDVPAGSLAYPVVITMHAADPFDLLDGNHAAGPAIEFGPSGTQFDPSKQAQVTVPFDAGLFADPATELTVYVLHGGVVEAVPKPYTFPGPGLVSFPTPSFSTFVAGRGGPRPLTGSWAVVTLDAEPTRDFGGAAHAGIASLDFDPASGWTHQDYGPAVEWIRAYDDGFNPLHPALGYPVRIGFESGLTMVQDDVRIVLDGAEVTPTAFARGPGGDVMLVPPVAGDPLARLRVALRRARGVATTTNLAGKWNLVFIGGGARSQGGPGGSGTPGVDLYTMIGSGTMTFALDGDVQYTLRQTESVADYPTGAWTRSAFTENGTGRITAGDGAVFLQLGETRTKLRTETPSEQSTDPPMRLVPCLDGDVLVGASESGGGDGDLMVVFFVRQGTNLRAADLNGDTTFHGIDFETADGAPSLTPPTIEFSTLSSKGTHTGGRTVAFTGPSGDYLRHDAAGDPVLRTTADDPLRTTFTLSKTGVYGTGAEPFGIVSPRRDLMLVAGIGESNVFLFVGIPGFVSESAP